MTCLDGVRTLSQRLAKTDHTGAIRMGGGRGTGKRTNDCEVMRGHRTDVKLFGVDADDVTLLEAGTVDDCEGDVRVAVRAALVDRRQ